jgi:hypothetical protein
MSIEAMKQALEAFEWNYNTDLDNISACEQWAKMLKKNITDLRQAIEQAQQAEPVAWMTHSNDITPLFHKTKKGALNWQLQPTPLYTSPPPRQPLTDEKIAELWLDIQVNTPASGVHEDGLKPWRFARAIEAACTKGEA